jgi:hypothetical protein
LSNQQWPQQLKPNSLLETRADSNMQKLEGDIALLMIEWALDQQIPLLAVHDSFAVRKQDEQATDQAKDAAWEKVIRLATKQG